MMPTAESNGVRQTIQGMIADELGRDLTPPVASLVGELRRRYGDRIAAILFYGSCLRSPDLDGVFDFYLLSDSHRDFYDSRVLAAANAMLPPNVFFLSADHEGRPVRAKVAVMSRRQFAGAMRRTALSVSVWARFCQPAILAYARDADAVKDVHAALVDAIVTAGFWAARFAPERWEAKLLWSSLFRATYDAELRVERADARAELVYLADAMRYDALTAPALIAAGVPFAWDAERRVGTTRITAKGRRQAHSAWRRRSLVGKMLTLLRLAKATFTFEGGVDYICWKIERHSGVAPQISPWQKRHPILAGPLFAYRLYRRRAIR